MRNLLVLLCTVLIWSPLNQANQGNIIFRSEVAGGDLPFSDAVLTGNTLQISGKGGVMLGTRTVPNDPQEEARLLMEESKQRSPALI